MNNGSLNIEQKKRIIKEVSEIVKARQMGEGSGHDWWHTYRVWQIAKKINSTEKTDFLWLNWERYYMILLTGNSIKMTSAPVQKLPNKFWTRNRCPKKA